MLRKMNGDGGFNGQILVDKLAKLNSSQQSIETLSHWCIFHRKNAKQVVETWDQQFHHSSKDQRVSFLYLANDILQNSRKKGMEFVSEFWKVLPKAFSDVIENGDDSGRKAALRMVDIWEDRKVFSYHGNSLKEEFLGRSSDEKIVICNLNQPCGDILEKLISGYQHVYDVCNKTAIGPVKKVEKEIGSNFGNVNESRVADELKAQHSELIDCMEQLKAAESARTTLASLLKEALNEQESKYEQLQNLLQVAQAHYDHGERILKSQNQTPLPPPDRNHEVPPPPTSSYTEAMPPPDFLPESVYAPRAPQQLPPFPQLNPMQPPLPLPPPPMPVIGLPPFAGSANMYAVEGLDAAAAAFSARPLYPVLPPSNPPK